MKKLIYSLGLYVLIIFNAVYMIYVLPIIGWSVIITSGLYATKFVVEGITDIVMDEIKRRK